jgi:recombination protein RecR
MDRVIPEALSKLIEAFEQLPGVGPRTAERFAYYLFKSDQLKSSQLADNLNSLHSNIKLCPKTFALIDSSEEVSPLYSDDFRNKKIVAVVADPLAQTSYASKS